MLPGLHLIKGLIPGGDSRGPVMISPIGGESATIDQLELAALYQFWCDKKAALKRLPARNDFSPIELKKLLPHIALVDVEHAPEGSTFTFRLCGTQIVLDCGADLTGKAWNDLPNTDMVIERGRQLVADQQPYYSTGLRATWAPKNFQHYSVLGLPLSKDGTLVDMILYGLVFHPAPR